MRRNLLALATALLLLVVPVRAAIAVVAATGASGGLSSVTTSNIDTTGSSLITVVLASASGANAITDSASNSWSSLTAYGAGPQVRIFYKVSPTTSATHTFSTGDFAASICVIAFSGTGGYGSQETGASNGSGTTLATGSITPAVNNTLLVTGFTHNNNSGTPDASVDSSFSEQADVAANAGNNVACAIAYKVQTTATAENVTWSQPNGGAISKATGIAVFLEPAVSSASVPMILGFMPYTKGGFSWIGAQ